MISIASQISPFSSTGDTSDNEVYNNDFTEVFCFSLPLNGFVGVKDAFRCLLSGNLLEPFLGDSFLLLNNVHFFGEY